jgi:hypothetical protein
MALSDEQRQQVVAALQQYQQNPQAAIESIRPLADAGVDEAVALMASLLAQQGRAPEGVQYARPAAAKGNGQIAVNYLGNLIGQADAGLRQAAVEFLDDAINAGWPVDPLAYVPQAIQLGDQQLTLALIDRANPPLPPHAQREQWEQLLSEVRGQTAEVDQAATDVQAQRGKVLGAMDAELEKIQSRGQEIETIANELGVTAQRASAVSMAKAYSDRAESVEATATWYTRVAIVLGAASVIGAIVVGLLTLRTHGISTAAQRAAFALPVAIFAALINRLANAYRHEAWRLRHVELQLRTSNPFLGGLEEDKRKEVLAQLALRFFPGQETQISPASESQPPADIVDLLLRLATRERSAPAPETRPPDAETQA